MWKFIKSGVEGNCTLYGKNIFDYKWKSTGLMVDTVDPVYGHSRMLTIYDVELDDETVTFAAGEFSNGVYGFYTKS